MFIWYDIRINFKVFKMRAQANTFTGLGLGLNFNFLWYSPITFQIYFGNFVFGNPDASEIGMKRLFKD